MKREEHADRDFSSAGSIILAANASSRALGLAPPNTGRLTDNSKSSIPDNKLTCKHFLCVKFETLAFLTCGHGSGTKIGTSGTA